MRARPLAERFHEKVDRSGGPDACWLWTASRKPNGYGQISDGAGRVVKSHRVAWELAHGPPPRGLCVCHRCNVKACCNPSHLYLATSTENSRDALSDGIYRPVRGERHGKAKLTEAQVREIRARRAAGDSLGSIAREFGVSSATISFIATRKRWGHLEAA